MEINDKVVIVTGASAGIGLATARYLSSQGARLVLAARNADKLQEVAQELPGSLAVPTDVTRPEDAKHLVERTVAEFGRIDVLVNGAARAMATILNISSQASRKHIPYIAGYASTKYALNALSLTAREELAAANITVSVILPGIVETGFGQNTPSPEPDSLRHAPDGALLPHVILPETVAERIGDLIRSGDAELDLPEP
jgi:NADP-dependent 3-hydroxy acid dehydrogenase YdfG